jgi:UPF0755 protein
VGGYLFYKWIFNSSIQVPDGKDAYELFIPTGSGYDFVFKKMVADKVLKQPEAFDFLAKKMKYPEKVKAGRYLLSGFMTNRSVINKLRAGNQDPIKYTFVKFRLKNDIVQSVKGKFEFKPEELDKLLSDDNYLRTYGLNPQTATAFFIPNTYQLKWNITAEDFFKRMQAEYVRFWNEKRETKRKALNLSQTEVISLAAIVEEETNANDEKPRIAGVYLNRLRKGWTLGADPTVKFAVGDFTLKRILDKHTAIESPYNTYIHTGLPPGPICTPSIPSIDAVLSPEEHEYMFFCAQPGLTGKHNFGKNAAEHKQNADIYHEWLKEYLKTKKDEAAKENK